MMGTINKYKEQALEVKKKCEKQMPIKQKEMKVIGEKYQKIMKEKAKQLQEDAGKFKADFEQLKGAIGVVQKIMQDMQVPGAMEAVQAEVQANIIEEAKAKGAPPDLDEAKLKSEAKKYFLKKYQADILKAFPKMGKALNESGRHIAFNMCEWGKENPWEWGDACAQSWRATGDHTGTWSSTKGIISQVRSERKHNGK